MGTARRTGPQKAELPIPVRLAHPNWDPVTAQSVHKRIGTEQREQEKKTGGAKKEGEEGWRRYYEEEKEGARRTW